MKQQYLKPRIKTIQIPIFKIMAGTEDIDKHEEVLDPKEQLSKPNSLWKDALWDDYNDEIDDSEKLMK